jgi:hypothetical protein
MSQNIVNDYDFGAYMVQQRELSNFVRLRDVLSHVDQYALMNPNVWRDPIVLRNPNLTVDFINDNPDKPWNWYNPNPMLNNPNLTLNDIESENDNEMKWRDSESERKWREKDRHQRMKQAERLKLKDRKRRYMIPNNIQRHQKKEKKRYSGRY